MAYTSTTERLQPSLLDRLTDLEPQQKDEPRDRRVISVGRLRECIRRDLGALLNTINLRAVEHALDSYPAIAASTLNYGIPELSGMTASSADPATLESAIKQAILDFEPRILPNTLKVQARLERGQMNRGALSFFIDGEMWAQPVPIALYLETILDLETGGAAVNERNR